MQSLIPRIGNIFVTYFETSILTLYAQRNKMVKHTQAICWQQSTNYLSVFDHSVELELKGLKIYPHL